MIKVERCMNKHILCKACVYNAVYIAMWSTMLDRISVLFIICVPVRTLCVSCLKNLNV